MKMWIALAAVAALVACSQPADKEDEAPAPVTVNAPSGEYALDPNHSTMIVRAPHFGLASYQLRFNGLSGALNFNAENPAQSTVQITVDATSLDTPYSGDRDFDAELQNSEWLDSGDPSNGDLHAPPASSRPARTPRASPAISPFAASRIPRRSTSPTTAAGASIRWECRSPASASPRAARSIAPPTAWSRARRPRPSRRTASATAVELVIEAEFNRPLDQAPAAAEGEPMN